MIDPTGRVRNLASVEAIVSGSSKSKPLQSQSFASELSDKLAGGTEKSPVNTGLPASLAVGQQSVTWRDTGVAGGPTAGTASEPTGLDGLVITYPSTTSPTASEPGVSSQQPMSFDQAYWAQQPAPVQQLQNIQDPTQRAQVASQLAQEGYSIDVPIMVWGWDPQITTAARESMGYTWVPSADQKPVEVAPGLTFAGAAPYNPASPPAGSITV